MPNRTKLRACLAAAFATLLLAGAASASDWDFGLRGGLWGDEPDGFVGIEGLTEMGNSSWYVNPNAEAIFVDRGDLFAASVDFHRDFPINSASHFWLGAGPTVLFRDYKDRRGPDADVDDTDFGGNLVGGFGFLEGRFRPYVQGKVVLTGEETEAVVGLGFRIR